MKCERFFLFLYPILGTVALFGFSACNHDLNKPLPTNTAVPPIETNSPHLDGLWVMGNASSGTEATTVIRIERSGNVVKGIIDQPAKDYAEQFGVKNGDLEFEGTIDGRRIHGKVHSYLGIDEQEDCPKMALVTLKDFEMSLSEDGSTLDGWTVYNRVNVEKCQEYRKGRSPYNFKRVN